jgi:uncharacterized membrane protein
MDRMLVVVFDNESKAYEGKNALQQLDGEGSISVYGYAVLAKNADGTATVKQGDDVGPIGTLLGTSLGSLIGVLVLFLSARLPQGFSSRQLLRFLLGKSEVWTQTYSSHESADYCSCYR